MSRIEIIISISTEEEERLHYLLWFTGLLVGKGWVMNPGPQRPQFQIFSMDWNVLILWKILRDTNFLR